MNSKNSNYYIKNVKKKQKNMSFLNKLKKNIGVEKEEIENEEEYEEEELEATIKPKKKIKIKEKKPKKRIKKEEIEEEYEEEEIEEEIEEPKKKSKDLSLKEKLGGEKGELAVDVYQTDKDIVIQSAIAGIEPEDLDISIEDDVLVIKGERNARYEKQDKNYYYQECYWGEFVRRIILPEEVDNSSVKAELKQGILTITIPKIEKKKKKIVVKG